MGMCENPLCNPDHKYSDLLSKVWWALCWLVPVLSQARLCWVVSQFT